MMMAMMTPVRGSTFARRLHLVNRQKGLTAAFMTPGIIISSPSVHHELHTIARGGSVATPAAATSPGISSVIARRGGGALGPLTRLFSSGPAGAGPYRTEAPAVAKIEAVAGGSDAFKGDLLVLPVFQVLT